ncbi:MAG TPA: dTMP kinase [Candidatus Norongarragalinales archaeon]|nr:dTMP kinase [Candidatus Norongarragalinales archaeon]
MKGKLIVLEGLSAAGKNTQSRKLVDRLKASGKKAELVIFPDYGSPVGKLIAQYLAGKLGNKEDLVEKACLLYAVDRYDHAERIRKLLKQGVFVVADRYSPSNYAFQGALVKNQQALWNWIDGLESLLPKPDRVLFLDVPRRVTSGLYRKRVPKNSLTKKDIHENDAPFEGRVYRNYVRLCKRNGYKRVGCVENGKLLPPDHIHQKVWSALSGII